MQLEVVIIGVHTTHVYLGTMFMTDIVIAMIVLMNGIEVEGKLHSLKGKLHIPENNITEKFKVICIICVYMPTFNNAIKPVFLKE